MNYPFFQGKYRHDITVVGILLYLIIRGPFFFFFQLLCVYRNYGSNQELRCTYIILSWYNYGKVEGGILGNDSSASGISREDILWQVLILRIWHWISFIALEKKTLQFRMKDNDLENTLFSSPVDVHKRWHLEQVFQRRKVSWLSKVMCESFSRITGTIRQPRECRSVDSSC